MWVFWNIKAQAHCTPPSTEQPPNPFLTVPLTRNQEFQLWAYGKGSAHSPQSSNADSETSQACLFFLLILSLLSRFTIFSIEFVLLLNCSHSFWNSWVFLVLLDLSLWTLWCCIHLVHTGTYYSGTGYWGRVVLFFIFLIFLSCELHIWSSNKHFYYNSYILSIAMFSVFK